MSKKFSTLMASLLFASAFTVNAATPVEGDNVRLELNSQYIGIDATNGLRLGGVVAPNNEDEGNFEAVNRQLWKIAKITKSSTGQEVYQFVNKWTGEYLAIKLQSNQKANAEGVANSTGTVKLDPTGNKEWAFDPTTKKLWAYDSATDSTYYLSNTMGLIAKKSNDHSGAASVTPTDISSVSMGLTAKTFNALMGLPGNNAKLNFNNGKDVTSTQTNQLKNVKWVADVKASGTDIFLTNGTTEGYKANLSGKEQRNLYLQVDTSYYDEKTPNYFKLDVDTLGIQPGESGSKVIDRHPTNLAKFAATYFFGNDSIAIQATTLPAKGMSGGSAEQPAVFASTSLTKTTLADQKVEISTIISNAVAKISESVDIYDALKTIEGAVATWNQSADGNFSTDYATALTSLTSALGSNGEGTIYAPVKTYLENAQALAYRTAGLTIGNGWGTSVNNPVVNAPSGANAKKLKAAAGQWISDRPVNSITEDEKFSDAYYTFVENGGNYTATEADSETAGALHMGTLINLVAQEEPSTVGSGTQSKLLAMACRTKGYSVDEFETGAKATAIAALPNVSGNVKFFSEAVEDDALFLQSAYGVYLATTASVANGADLAFAGLKFNQEGTLITIDGSGMIDASAKIGTLTTANAEEDGVNDADVAKLIALLSDLNYKAVVPAGQGQQNPYFFNVSNPATGAGSINNFTNGSFPVVLRSLADVTVLTVAVDGATIADPKGYVLPLIQPYATSGGDATDIAGGAKIYNLQVKDASTLRATSTVNKYVVSVKGETKPSYVTDIDASNVYAQWVFIPGTSGFYSIVNRATEQVLYTGPVSKVKDADDKVVADTYVLGSDTLKLASVELSTVNVYEEGDNKVKYDYTGTYYAGTGEGTAVYKSFAINPVSPFLSQLAAQFNKDSVMVLGNADDAPVWYMEKAGDGEAYGVKIEGLPRLKKQLYRIYTRNADDKKIYVYANTESNANVYAVSLLGSKHVHLNGDGTAVEGAANFEFRNIAEGQYQFISSEEGEGQKMTINATPSKPILEVSKLAEERNDLFMINKSEVEKYRKLTAEDGVLGNAKIYMENEPNRYLYENTANIVANNGTGLNFLGIYNTAELTKNAALYVDTAFVERKDVYMPQYMFALGVEEVEAQDAVACTYEHNHYDNAGNKVDAAHCSHATPATMGYKSGRYLVALNDSTPENGSKKTPVYYDNAVRLAFVNAIHRNAEDSLIIKDSKWTDNNKQIVAGEETTYASKDTIKIADNKLNAATFALLIKDQETKSFYLQTANAGDKAQFVRILNGVPVLTKEIEDAAVFNIEATTEEATANEAIAAEGVQVIAGKGTVTVQGAAGKVITVANILGQTIANQVAASDNVTIAAPAGVVVVAVEGEATKVVVK